MNMLFTSLSAYSAIRAGLSTDVPHLLAYGFMCALSLYLSITGIDADCDNAD